MRNILVLLGLICSTNGSSLCDCGNFIGLDLLGGDKMASIEKFREFLGNPLIQDRRLYVVGYFGETDVLSGVILNELHENYKSISSPDCLVHKSKFTALLDTNCSVSHDSASIQLWNDVFLYESQNQKQIAMIFMSFRSRPSRSQLESRILSAFSGLLSTIYFVLGEESFYNEYYGKESQECDFNFHINELDHRNEIDESILEMHSILSHQNLEMHEDLHFARENLNILNFLEILNFGIDKVSEIKVETKKKLEKLAENLKKLKSFDDFFMVNSREKNVSEFLKTFKEEAVSLYMDLTAPQIQIPEISTPKLQRKLKIFVKKLRQTERIAMKKFQNFVTEITEDFKMFFQFQISENPQTQLENSRTFITKTIETRAANLFDISQPLEEKIRHGIARNYVKTLQKLFETSNNEIRKSQAFKKLMRQRKISIPLPCDVKC